jgi:hypothetical protein
MKFPAWSRAVHAVGIAIMQRWIVAGVVAMLLMGAGGFLALKSYKQNRPVPVWVPLPINPELPTEKCDEIVAKLKDQLGKPEVLAKVSADVGLVRKWELPSDEAGAAELGRRLFVKTGEMDSPMGRVPAIHIGVTGKRKERQVTGEIAMRLMEDVWPILGLEPPPKKGN